MRTVIDKLLSGIKAAIILVGLVILLGIAVSVSAWPDFFHANQWTQAGIHETFLAVVLLGLVLGWCFPAKIKKHCRTIFIVPSIVLFLMANFLLVIGEYALLTPWETKLADCSGSIVTLHLTAPKGRHYVLFLNGLPSSYKFTGHLWITTGTSQTMSIALNSDKMFASSGELNLGPVNLEGGKDYDLKIEFNPPPPPSSFISLHWMQSNADRNE